MHDVADIILDRKEQLGFLSIWDPSTPILRNHREHHLDTVAMKYYPARKTSDTFIPTM